MGFFKRKKREPTPLVRDTDPNAPQIEKLFLTGATGILKQGGAAYQTEDLTGLITPKIRSQSGAANPAGWLMGDSYCGDLDYLSYGAMRDKAMIAAILRKGLNVSADRLYGNKRQEVILALCHLHDLWFGIESTGTHWKLMSDNKRLLKNHFSQYARCDDKGFLHYWEFACMDVACHWGIPPQDWRVECIRLS